MGSQTMYLFAKKARAKCLGGSLVWDFAHRGRSGSAPVFSGLYTPSRRLGCGD